jgi:hypothetical protein
MAAYAQLLYNAPQLEESLQALAALAETPAALDTLKEAAELPLDTAEDKPLQARETLAARFHGLGINDDEEDSWEDAVTPYSTAAFLGCSTPCTESGPTPTVGWDKQWQTPRKVSIGEDRPLEKRVRSLSGPITPPTTTAGSSQNTSPARTPREESGGDYNAFDLPCLLPTPGFGW